MTRKSAEVSTMLKVRGIIIHLGGGRKKKGKTLHKHFSGCNFQYKDTFPSRKSAARRKSFSLLKCQIVSWFSCPGCLSRSVWGLLQSLTPVWVNRVIEEGDVIHVWPDLAYARLWETAQPPPQTTQKNIRASDTYWGRKIIYYYFFYAFVNFRDQRWVEQVKRSFVTWVCASSLRSLWF